MATLLFLQIVYLQLTQGKDTTRYPWLAPELYSDILQTLLNRSNNFMERALNSPPKPHAFVSLPLQSKKISKDWIKEKIEKLGKEYDDLSSKTQDFSDQFRPMSNKEWGEKEQTEFNNIQSDKIESSKISESFEDLSHVFNDDKFSFPLSYKDNDKFQDALNLFKEWSDKFSACLNKNGSSIFDCWSDIGLFDWNYITSLITSIDCKTACLTMLFGSIYHSKVTFPALKLKDFITGSIKWTNNLVVYSDLHNYISPYDSQPNAGNSNTTGLSNNAQEGAQPGLPNNAQPGAGQGLPNNAQEGTGQGLPNNAQPGAGQVLPNNAQPGAAQGFLNNVPAQVVNLPGIRTLLLHNDLERIGNYLREQVINRTAHNSYRPYFSASLGTLGYNQGILSTSRDILRDFILSLPQHTQVYRSFTGPTGNRNLWGNITIHQILDAIENEVNRHNYRNPPLEFSRER